MHVLNPNTDLYTQVLLVRFNHRGGVNVNKVDHRLNVRRKSEPK